MNIRLILGDQLSHNISSLKNIDKASDIVLMMEVMSEANYVKHHKKKIAFIFSAMRHFAKELEAKGIKVSYIKLDDKENSGSFKGEVERSIKKFKPKKIIVTFPGEYRVLKDIQSWEKDFGVKVEIKEDTRFLCSKKEFEKWAKDKKSLRMEFFYRNIRKKYKVLMEGENPIGGKWNFDNMNRKKAPNDLDIPESYKIKPDSITKEVFSLVEKRFSDHFGDLLPFNYAVTKDQAWHALDLFVKERLENFGEYQDAMLEQNAMMFHAHIGLYLNIGLLEPMEVIKKIESAYYYENVSLNSVEGFIRQIIGWREFVRGIYWLKMPEYKNLNFLEAKEKLPDFYWDAKTDMNCLKQAINNTKENAYAHHIQRLMVLGNFALILGVDPDYINEWFLIVYADAYEWVELPNVSGMAVFADGGFLASKPYCSTGSYINKMSNYCKNCKYKVSIKNGDKACPFNYLFWDFIDRNFLKLKSNRRMNMMIRIYKKFDNERLEEIRSDARKFKRKLA